MIKFYSTKQKSIKTSFKRAVIQGLAEDGGLFMPEKFPEMPADFFSKIHTMSFQEISFRVAERFLCDSIPADELEQIIYESLNFALPLVRLDEDLYVLELFHGPTLAFKDFAARFMARIMAWFVRDSGKELTVLVATSGDTGSAVANGFYKIPGINVIILYPSKRISNIQEMQITTLQKNITALEIEGTFDDCQQLVKQAFLDAELSSKLWLTSANSINIARLIPQSFYYFYAFSRLNKDGRPLVFSVPSGNYGNLTGGLFSKKMGLPVKKIIAATNSNKAITNYLKTGIFQSNKTIKTISNAMDVGNPNNFSRILDLYHHNHGQMQKDIFSASFSDEQTQFAILEVWQNNQYILDPHSAIGYLGVKKYLEKNEQRFMGICLATAHPAKFPEVVETIIGRKLDVPSQLSDTIKQKKQSVVFSKHYSDLKEYLSQIS